MRPIRHLYFPPRLRGGAGWGLLPRAPFRGTGPTPSLSEHGREMGGRSIQSERNHVRHRRHHCACRQRRSAGVVRALRRRTCASGAGCQRARDLSPRWQSCPRRRGRARFAAPPALDHRSRSARQPADDVVGRALRARLQRRDLQLPRAARGACARRPRLPHLVRQRGAHRRLCELGREGAAAVHRDVRLRSPRPRTPGIVPGPRSLRHQAAVLGARPQPSRHVFRDRSAARRAGRRATYRSSSRLPVSVGRPDRRSRADDVRQCPQPPVGKLCAHSARCAGGRAGDVLAADHRG